MVSSMASPEHSEVIKQWTDVVPIIGGLLSGALLFLGVTRFFNWLASRMAHKK